MAEKRHETGIGIVAKSGDGPSIKVVTSICVGFVSQQIYAEGFLHADQIRT